MTLFEQIQNDIKAAMRERNIVRLDALRMLKSDIGYRLIEKKMDVPTDADVIEVLQKRVRKHKDAIEGFEKGGRTELAAKERAELEVISAYLPKELSRDEVEAIVAQAITETGSSTAADMGKVMKVVIPRVAGRADGKLVSEIVRSKLG